MLWVLVLGSHKPLVLIPGQMTAMRSARACWLKSRDRRKPLSLISSTMPPNNPKTPTRHRSRSETKTPLTPSLATGLNPAANNSPTKSRFPKQSGTAVGDVSNPFIATTSKSKSTSRSPSPIKRLTGGIQVTDSLAKQAGGGIIRKGGAESRIDVITRDYVPPPKTEMKRSRSTPANRSVGPSLFRCSLS